MTEWNKVAKQIVQSSRYLGVNFLFALPQLQIPDVDARRICHAYAVIRGRDFAVIYKAEHNYFTGSLAIFTTRIGSVQFGLPSKQFYTAHEKKRAAFDDKFFEKYYKEEEPEPQEEKPVDIVKKDLTAYLDERGKISANNMVAKHGVSYTTAYQVKAQVEQAEPGES